MILKGYKARSIHITTFVVLSGLCLWLLSGCNQELPDQTQLAYDQLPEHVDYNFQVRPILSDKCFTCHGPDETALKAGLRLDIRDSAIGKLESGEVAIVPGQPFKSHLVERILSDDNDQVMPPPESHLSLEEQDKATLIKWIEQGAEYKPHWAFIPPESVDQPSVEDPQWPQNDIDYFVLAAMTENGFAPSNRAPRETLIRRLYFNLTGLPPSPEVVDNFLNDQAEDAYEQLVDRLLSNPAYGERMAMDWMDVSRYADSDGYLDDKHRDFSPWRDWVIEAFNQNMPYDQFVTWQLAGDLLPEPSQNSILATAFNRLHKKNSEAGIVFEEYRTEYVADRTNTVGKAFLGLSMECARCHDHKYDPISQREYYQLFAFFNSTDEFGSAVYGPDQTPGPALLLSSEEQEQILEYLERDIDKLEADLSSVRASEESKRLLPNADKTIASLERQSSRGLIGYFSFDQLMPDGEKSFKAKNGVDGTVASVKEPELRPGAKGQAIFLNDFTRITLPQGIGWFERTDPFSISLAIYPDSLYQEAGLLYHCEDLRLGLKGYSLFLEENRLKFIISHSWPQNSIQVVAEQPLNMGKWNEAFITYDGSSKGKGVRIYIDGRSVPVTIEYDHLYKGILYQPDIHTYGFAGMTLGERNKMKTFKHGGLDELKIYNRDLTALEVLYQHDKQKVIDYVQNWDPSTDALAQEYFVRHMDKQAEHISLQLRQLREQLNNTINDIPEIMVMGDRKPPRPTYILDRGMYDAPSEEVTPGTPESIMEFDSDLPQNRLGLARWLFNENNPLTARVFVNRVWQMHFGRGIVETPDDFGSQGGIPSHPELLDWLAVEFIRSGWDIKRLHKMIVMSSTFQQSSHVSQEQLELDPKNEWYARGPSYRLPAEMIRDNALAVSGLLVSNVGGESVYPYQPDGLWDELSNKKWRYQYLQEPGEGLYRRSLYTIWKRTSPPPSMLIFDVGDRSVCQVKRTNTSTPLQALVLLNDPQYLEASRALAERLLMSGKGKKDDAKQYLSLAFSRIIGRSPDSNEVQLLEEFYQEELKRFSADRQTALEYLNIGEHPREERLDPIETAALATVVSGIFNTYESYTLK